MKYSLDLQRLKNMFQENFQKCKEKEAHIQEGTILKNKVSYKHIFQPYRPRLHFKLFHIR